MTRDTSERNGKIELENRTRLKINLETATNWNIQMEYIEEKNTAFKE